MPLEHIQAQLFEWSRLKVVKEPVQPQRAAGPNQAQNTRPAPKKLPVLTAVEQGTNKAQESKAHACEKNHQNQDMDNAMHHIDLKKAHHHACAGLHNLGVFIYLDETVGAGQSGDGR